MQIKNLFHAISPPLPEEEITRILDHPGLRLERIVSKGHATPAGEWYDQESDEWVLLLSGSAGLLIEGEEKPLTLQPGDHLILPAHRRHRVEWTDPDSATVWLALHFPAQP